MERSWLLTPIVALVIASSAGCAPRTAQDPDTDSPDGGGRGGPITEQAVEPTGARPGTTGEETTSDGGLECPGGMAVGGVDDYAPGAEGKKRSPVELARRDFSKQIRKGDDVGLSITPQRGEWRTVRVERDGRTVSLIQYRRAGGGWLRDSYDACASF